MTKANPLFLVLSVILILGTTGCQTAKTGGKVLVTPLTVVRDVVDVPLTTLANVFEDFSDDIRPRRGGGGGFSLGSLGFGLTFVEALAHYTLKGFSGIFGGLDYLICRSLWPNWAKGVNPWRGPGKTWGDMYFPNTRVLWGDNAPIEGSVSKPRSAPKETPAEEVAE